EPAPPETVREAWRRFRASVPGRGKESWTPGDLARRAADRGYPRGPVDALTEAFRGIRYGNRPATADRRERALDAYDRLRRALDGSDDDAPDDGSAGDGAGTRTGGGDD
ncbi:DUF4129 domain-containing protein, partial [Halobaculum lipolyticum]